MHADRLHLDPDDGAVDRGDFTLVDHGQRPFGDEVGIPQNRIRGTARNKTSVRPVGAIGECLCHRSQPEALRFGEENRTGQPQHRQPGVDGVHGLGHGTRLVPIRDDRVVQRAMGFDIAQFRTRGAGEGLQGTDLVHDVGRQFHRGDVDAAPAKPGEVEVSDLGADPHPAPGRGAAGSRQADRVSRVEAAGEVGAGDDVEHRGVVTEFPHPEPFGEVGIEIDGAHRSSLGRSRIQPTGADRPAGQIDHERDGGDEDRDRHARGPNPRSAR